MNWKELKTWELICKQKGIDPKLPDVSTFPKYLQNYMLNVYMAVIIIEVINCGWLADEKNWKYELWHSLKKDKKSSTGFGFSHSYPHLGGTATIAGLRLSIEDQEKAMFIMEYFPDVFLILKTDNGVK